MSIANKAAYDTKISAPWRRINDTKNSLSTIAGRYYSLWNTLPDAGAAPTTAEAPTTATAGSLGQNNNGGGTVQRLASIIASTQNAGTVLVVDRLSHSGGLSGIVTTAQTTNLPTAALTRYTDGVGVMAALEIYTAIGTTATTVTASYTNTASVSQTSLATAIGTTTFNSAGRLIMLPLVAGDLGVLAVASVTLLASTATAGNFGVTLFRPLAVLPSATPGEAEMYELLYTMGFIPAVPEDSCLQYHVLSNLTATGVLQTSHSFIEEK